MRSRLDFEMSDSMGGFLFTMSSEIKTDLCHISGKNMWATFEPKVPIRSTDPYTEIVR